MSCINGCGPSWFPEWARSKYFKEECQIHDKYYNQGVSKPDADYIFRTIMHQKIVDDAMTYQHSHLVATLRHIQAEFYYFMAHLFGQRAYDRSNPCTD